MPKHVRTLSLALSLALSLPVSACRETVAALGTTPAAARDNADELIRAIGGRFGPMLLDSAYVAARVKFAKGALVPSRLYNDWDVWTAAHGQSRTLEEAGGFAPDVGDYRIGMRAGAPAPRAVGDYRKTLQLRPLAEDVFEWQSRDELAIGAVRTSELGRALTALLTGPERASGEAFRAEAHEVLPRTAAALGRLVSLDTLRFEPTSDGATDVWVAATIRPRGIAADFPNYAKYLDKYVTPLAYAVELYDDAGAHWAEARQQNGHLSMRMRVADGYLAPLDAPPRRLPDQFHARIDVTAKALFFRVGVRGLEGDVALTRAPREARRSTEGPAINSGATSAGEAGSSGSAAAGAMACGAAAASAAVMCSGSSFVMIDSPSEVHCG
jgi:hypothetical protein